MNRQCDAKVPAARCNLPPVALNSVASGDAVQPMTSDVEPCFGYAEAKRDAHVNSGSDLAARIKLRVPAFPPSPPAVPRNAIGHELGPDGYLLREGSGRPLGFPSTAWNTISASGRAKHLATHWNLEAAKLRTTSRVSGEGEANTASGGADFVLGIVTKEAKATSGGTEGTRTLPPRSSTTPSWSTIIDLGVCSLVQPNTCGEAGLAMPAIRREPWNATCSPAMVVLGWTPTNTHRPKLPDHLLPAYA